MDEDLYTIPELIERLEKIKKDKEGCLNYPKTIMTLAQCIKRIDEELKSIDKSLDAHLQDYHNE